MWSQRRLEQYILQWIAGHADAAHVALRPDLSFSEIGLDSIDLSTLTTELSQQLQRVLSPTLAYAYPRVSALASFLSRPIDPQPSASSAKPVDPGSSIAIVGMACRFPKAPDVDAFWHMLVHGIEGVDETPPERWNARALHSDDALEPGTIRSTRGGFLPQVDRFDPLFFGISPHEAAQLDPQQRLMLELAWEALEDAGLPVEPLRGSATGVFIGAMWSEYTQLVYRAGPRAITPHTVMGAFHSFIANRISYFLGLQGPSIALDTVCSSSLVALHLACDSLRRGETTLALVGGVNLCLLPESTMMVSRGGALSPDGRCFTFDTRANGCIRGEGAGLVVLKPLLHAQRDGDFVYCVVRGSAVNNDGPSNGFSAPNPLAQEAVLTQAYRSAGVSPSTVTYVELHGTGTALGDPIEAGALQRVLCADRPADRPLRVGSVKTNLGHTEAAAGIAGLIKGALSLRHRVLPRSLNYQQRSPHIPADWPLPVQDQTTPWPDSDAMAATLGVSSFGMGGTNAHVVLQAAPTSRAVLSTWAAPTEDDMRQALADGRALAGLADPSAPLFPEGRVRVAVLGSSPAEHADRLPQALQHPSGRGVYTGIVDAPEPMVWVFSGQGSQWLGMGRSLLQANPTFRNHLQRCDRHVKQRTGWSLLDALFAPADSARLEHIEVSWPALVAIEIGLAAVLRSEGAQPTRIVGHSNGEVAAACAAGILSIDEAMHIACVQGRVMQRLHGHGGMALLELPWAQAQQAVADFADDLSCAIEASPDTTVVSGSRAALDAVLSTLQARGVPAHRIKVDVPGHSPLLLPLHPEIAAGLAGLYPHRGSIPLVSMATGRVETYDHFDRAYWVSQLSSPVRFAKVIRSLIDEGFRHFVEISPHPIVLHGIQSLLRATGNAFGTYASLRRDTDEHESLLGCLATLYVRGLIPHAGKPEPHRIAGNAEHADGSGAGRAAPIPAPQAPVLLPISARADVALRDLARTYAQRCSEQSVASLRALAAAASRRRSHHPHRVAVLGEDANSLRDALNAFVQEKPHPGLFHGSDRAQRAAGVLFLFSGHGGQWLGMGQALLRSQPVFAATLHACADALRAHTGRDLLQELHGAGGRDVFDRGDGVQPLLFSLQVALAALWQSLGIQPLAVVGTSMGEVAAAHVAGCLTLHDAMRIICERSRLLMRLVGQGAMAVVNLTQPEAQALCADHPAELSIAAQNGPQSCVLSGTPARIDAVLDQLAKRGVFCRRLAGGNAASHSPQVDVLRTELLTALSGLQPRPAQVPFWSTVTGQDIHAQALDAAYWFRNMREPVRLWSTLDPIFARESPVVLEVSPHPVLLSALNEGLQQIGKQALLLPSLRRQQQEDRCIAETLAQLYCAGADITWQAVPALDGIDEASAEARSPLMPQPASSLRLPSYPFVRERCWLDDATAEREAAPDCRTHPIAESANRGTDPPLLGHAFSVFTQPDLDFFGQTIALSPNAASSRQGPVTEARAAHAATVLPYLRDHQLEGLPIFPGSGYLEILLSVARHRSPQGPWVLRDVEFLRPLFLAHDDHVEVQTAVSAKSAPQVDVQIAFRVRGSWQQHARGQVDESREAKEAEAAQPIADLTGLRQRLASRSQSTFYAQTAALGGTYGPAFQGVQAIWCGEWDVLARVERPAPIGPPSDAGYVLHPAWLDACLHAVLGMDGLAKSAEPWLPVSIRSLRVSGPPPASVWVRAQGHVDDLGALADMQVQDEQGHSIVDIRGLRLSRLAAPVKGSSAHLLPWLFQRVWQHDAQLEDSASSEAECLAWVLPDSRGQQIVSRLRQSMRRVVLVVPGVPGSPLRRRSEGGFEIDPSDAHGYRLVLREAWASRIPPRHIVYAWSLPGAPADPTSDRATEAELEQSCRSALLLIQALIQLGTGDEAGPTPHLTLLTAGAQPAVPSDPVPGIAQAPLWGLGQVLALEHPQLAPLRMDVSADSSAPLSADELRALVCEVLQPRRVGSDLQVALRGADRYVCRLQRATTAVVPADASLRCLPDRSYVISGGRSGLGLALAERLVAAGARYLILLSRSAPTDVTRSALERLQAAGAALYCPQVDVTSDVDLRAAWAARPPTFPAVAGLVHAAATLDDGLLADLSWDRWQRVLSPKVRGALHLLSLLRDQPLDFVLLTSSVASLFGTPGQANYVAANTFLDALAHHLRHRGVPALSINLGLLLGSVFAQSRPDLVDRLHAQGTDPLDLHTAASAIAALLSSQEAQVGLLRVHAARFFAAFPDLQHDVYFRDLLPAGAASSTPSDAAPADGHPSARAGHSPSSLVGLDDAALRSVLREATRRVLSQILRVPLSRLDARTPLVRLGMDSLMAVQLRNRLAQELSISLPLGSLMQDAGVDTLVEALHQTWQRSSDSAPQESEITEGEL